jgi:beta-galactosidase
MHSESRSTHPLSSPVFTIVLAFSLAIAGAAPAGAPGPISLAGEWRFTLDRSDAGVGGRWFERSLEGKILLPGALQSQGFGDPIAVDTKWTGDVGADRWLRGKQYERYREPGNIKVPFFLQPERHYVGAAWYQRDIDVPAAWTGMRIVLTLERPHWETRAWIDGRELGRRDSLSTPHVYDLGTGLAPGKHVLTVRVDNRLIVDVGSWSHSVSDHTQGNWNGVVGRIELAAGSPVWIDDVAVFPDVAKRSVRLRVEVGNSTGKPGSGALVVGEKKVPVRWTESGGTFEVEVDLGPGAAMWDEFDPALHRLAVRLEGDDGARDLREATFGLREIVSEGRDFLLNGRKTFFRGTLECCIFPKTGHPPTDVESWRRVLRACRAHGLNHMRFHSWCPPEAAFQAADELGFYYQVECGVWTNPGSGKPIDRWIQDESERIVRAYGNHPSFVLLTHGNEPSGPGHEAYLARWVDGWKRKDPRRLYTSGSAYPQLPENQYHVYHACRGPHGWLGRDYRKDVEKLDVPVIVHEMGQWCVYPNFDEVSKYTGPLKAKNFEIFRDSLAEHGLLDRRREFLFASGKLQVLCYKEEIEAALRTPGIGGFQLLDLHDFPGQGTALVGVLDPFWESKGYVSAEEFRRFCGPTVPLARVLKRTWTAGETFAADLEVAQFGRDPIEGAVAAWKLVDAAGGTIAAGVLPARMLPVGGGTALGRIEANLSGIDAPRALKLVVAIRGTGAENDWGIWVYPARAAADPPGIHVAAAFDDAAIARLDAGGTVVLLSPKLSPVHPRLGFEPIFWNRYMFNTQGTQTLGLVVDPRHPALARFPTESFQDWQWGDIVRQARGVILDSLPGALRPIVAVIDDWNTNRKLALAFECRVGKGKLLVCSADLSSDLDRRPAARQLRESLLTYAAGTAFRPEVEVGKEGIAAALHRAGPSTLANFGAKVVRADSEDRPVNTADKAIDGDPETIWHTAWGAVEPPFPHELVIDMTREVDLAGFRCLPRQDMQNGWFTAYEFFVGADGTSWGPPVSAGTFPAEGGEKVVRFEKPVRGRFLRLVAKNGLGGRPFAAVAELDVILEKR